MANYEYNGDLPPDINLGSIVAIDTETMGLNPHRDRLCLVQLSSGDGNAHLVKVDQSSMKAPVLCSILADSNVLKLFHFGRFDIAVLLHRYKTLTRPVYCTKIASKLVRTFTNHHGLKNILQDLLSIDISKQQQSSDWGKERLTKEQLDYAASDVLYLHRIKEELDLILKRENRLEVAQACFKFLPYRASLDLLGWPNEDIFSHS
jgi:ribonuclease D